MKQERNSRVSDSLLGIGAGLVIGWLLGAGWWHVPGRGAMLLLAVVLVVVLWRRGRIVGEDFVEEDSIESFEEPPPVTSKPKRVHVEGEGEAVLQPNEAREWLDDLLVRQQKGRK